MEGIYSYHLSFLTVGTTLKTAEFDGFGIIEINMPSLIDPQGNRLLNLSIKS